MSEFSKLTAQQLESLTVDLDQEFVADKFKPLSRLDRHAWNMIRRGIARPETSEAAKGAAPMSSEAWTELQRRNPVGDTIRTWSAAKGLLNGSFKIESLSSSRIEVSSAGMNDPPRPITRGDFEKVLAVWPDYKAGTLSRSRLILESQNSTYIVSLLHWLESN